MPPSDHPVPSDRAPTLQSTKLFVPRSRQRLVPRPRLDARLDVPAPLTLVSAPAGFGKSTVVIDWLQRRDCRVSWLSLEPADSEPRRFLRYLLAAWRRVVPELGASLHDALTAPGPLLVDAELTSFLNEIGALDSAESAQDIVLVLDDYHSIEEPAIHGIVEAMLEALPPAVRLVLTTRVDPPLSLSRLRARGRLVELRAADLRFLAGEAAEFFRQAMDVDLREDEAHALQERTEGWIVGLQLAGLSLRGRARDTDLSLATFLDDFTGSHRFVLDYLTDEVLAREDKASLDFLLRISILQEVCGPLADAVAGSEADNSEADRADGQARLEALEDANLFLLPLDDHRRWYRFHHLFAECLRRYGEERLPTPERADLHRRASDWLLANGRPDAALDHALAADDEARARSVLREHTAAAIRRGEIEAVTRWFDRVPAAATEGDSLLTTTRALVLFMSMRWKDLEDVMPAVEKSLAGEPEDVELAGRLAVLRTLLGKAWGNAGAIADAGRQALRLLPETEVFLRGTVAALMTGALQRPEEADEEADVFRLAVELNGGSGHRMALVSSYYNHGRWCMLRGRLAEALDVHRSGIEAMRAPDGSLHALAGMSLAGEAEVLLERGQLDAAAAKAQQAIDVTADRYPYTDLSALLTLQSVARTQRRFDEAMGFIERLGDRVREADLEPWRRQQAFYSAQIQATKARLGDRNAEGPWQTWLEEGGYLGVMERTELASLLLPEAPQEGGIDLAIRWLIRQGEVRRAHTMTLELRGLIEARGLERSRIAVSLLEAQALAEDDPASASRALARAFEQSARFGYVQVLADEREWLGPWLRRDKQSEALLDPLDDAFRSRLLAALELPSMKFGSPGEAASVVQQDLPEALSERELEVLACVAAGRTNAAVGEQLFISPSTVKKHLENIYGKLAVGGRLEAVNRAQALGLLPGVRTE